MAARTKTKVSKYKTKYRVKNWAAYDIALRDRGEITVWFDDEAICAWNARPSGRPGGQRRYSDLAIVTALTLRTMFHLPLRQTEGFMLRCRSDGPCPQGSRPHDTLRLSDTGAYGNEYSSADMLTDLEVVPEIRTVC